MARDFDLVVIGTGVAASVAARACRSAGCGPPLTPTASLEGSVAAKNLLDGNRHRPNYAGLPSVVFTIPPLAFVGLRQADARERGLRFRTSRGDMSGWYSARRVGEDCAAYKVLVGEDDGRVLGAHLLGPGAEETINLFALAVRAGLLASDLEEMLTAYPSHGSDVASML
jgi:glutathione reductase (NADPH)